jgi:hypothetical protein
LNRIRPIKTGSRPSFFEGGRRFSVWLRRGIAAALFPAVYILAGCGGTLAGGSSNGIFTLSASPGTIDTNCTGCNLTTATGTLAEQFTATLASGGAADVVWSLSGGDAKAGAGSINASGQYTPPSYLTADSVRVTVTAALRSDPGLAASTTLTVTPGFLQPLTPENAALGNNGTVTVTGYLAEAGGSASINYALSSSETGSGGGVYLLYGHLHRAGGDPVDRFDLHCRHGRIFPRQRIDARFGQHGGNHQQPPRPPDAAFFADFTRQLGRQQ